LSEHAQGLFEWLALYLVPGLGNRSMLRLIERIGSPDRVFRSPVNELRRLGGLREDTARRVAGKVFSRDPERELHNAERLDARILTFEDARYPRLLRQIPDPPMILYVKGAGLDARSRKLAVVGSRGATPYGLKAARRIAEELGNRGVDVVSGMALGIDTAAHWGALNSGARTIAVLGTGIDRVYPRSGDRLFAEITQKGAVLTEFPVGTPPEPRNFPVRNRVISGLSLGVLVVEAAMRSGSLITASCALEQGREVFAVPGSVNSFKSRGCHFLLKQGAALAESAEDVLEALNLSPVNGCCAGVPDQAPADPDLGRAEKEILALLGDDPVHIDLLVRGSAMSPSSVLALLTKMELTGLVEQLPGKLFVRV